MTQALLLSGRHAGLDTIYIQRWASSLCYCRCDLTEIGSPMLIKVNNDVTGGLTLVIGQPPCDIIIDPN